MFGRATPECPIDLETKNWIDSRWAWLTDQFGLARLRSAEVILPTADFFPDAFDSTPEAARLILDRVCVYMGIAPELVELSWYEDRNPVHDGEWQRRTAGLYHEEAGKFHVWVEIGNLHDPLALVATMAHELGHVHLLGHRRISADAEDHEPLTDLLTVYVGMGVFTANSVIRERYWDAGAVAGWNMGRQGYFSMPMFGYALARFAEARDEEEPEWAKHLRADVHSPFVAGSRFLTAVAQGLPVSVPTNLQDQGERSPQEDDAEPQGSAANRPAISAEELLTRFASGDRDFRDFDLQGVSLRGAELLGIDLAGADLSEADLTNAVLTEANLSETDLQNAVLCGANLERANLKEADLSEANLTAADLSDADIRGTDFTRAWLEKTILVGTLRDGATDLSAADLSDAVCDISINQDDPHAIKRTNRVAAIMIVGCFAAIIGALVGSGVGGAISGKNMPEAGGLVGAVLFVVLSVWRLKKLWAKQDR